jgi:hypothetical protein
LSEGLGITRETVPHKGNNMPMFRKKPVVIEARQFFNDGSRYELIHWINEGQHAIGREFARWHNNEIIVPTLEGQHIASPGDWIIRGVAGEHYPCKPEIFSATYEAA